MRRMPMSESFVLSRAEVRELDRRAIDEYGLPGVVLMENAGRGAAELLLRLNPDHQRVLVLCGPGNNGGDGFVMARHLQNYGLDVDVLLFGAIGRLSADAEGNATIWRRSSPLWRADPNRPPDVDIWRGVRRATGRNRDA